MVDQSIHVMVQYKNPLPAISWLKCEALQHGQVISVGKGARYLNNVNTSSLMFTFKRLYPTDCYSLQLVLLKSSEQQVSMSLQRNNSGAITQMRVFKTVNNTIKYLLTTATKKFFLLLDTRRVRRGLGS